MPKEKAKIPNEKEKKVADKKEQKKIVREKNVTPRLYQRYFQEIIPALSQQLGYRNPLQLPKLEKVVINMGLGKAKEKEKSQLFDQAFNDLMMITGQKPIITKARKAVAGFKIKKGMNIGIKVTLRRKRMYEFLDRLLTTALPRIRDFRGFNPKSIDESGNFSFGISDYTVFPEVDVSKVQTTQGMDITLCIRCRKKDDSIALLRAYGFPFRG